MKKYCISTRVSTEEQGAIRPWFGSPILDQCREYIASDNTWAEYRRKFRDIRSGKRSEPTGLRRAMELAAREGAT